MSWLRKPKTSLASTSLILPLCSLKISRYFTFTLSSFSGSQCVWLSITLTGGGGS